MRKYKYIWLPALLAIYFIFMTIYFGLDLLRSGENIRFFATIGAETAVLIALVFFLKKREKLRNEREQDLKKNTNESHRLQ